MLASLEIQEKLTKKVLQIAVAQDANGFKVLYLPPQYLKADATEQDSCIFSEYQKIMANIIAVIQYYLASYLRPVRSKDV